MAEALVLEEKGVLRLRDIALEDKLGPNDVRVAIHTVGICGSDVHYYKHGAIGPFIVREPMVLGHEASGTIVEIGDAVCTLKPGDRVCMEPGIPDPLSRAARLGQYNIDPAVRFWATPPVHGCLTASVVHPAAYTFRLPDTVSFAEAAMVEPLAVGVHACVKARLQPGDVCLVTGAGPIGIVTALSALASGASQVFISDFSAPKLAIAGQYDRITPVDLAKEKPADVIAARCGSGWGVDVTFEASGFETAYDDALACTRPGGRLVLVGMPPRKVAFDIVAAQAREISIETVFRYAHVYDRAIALIASGSIDLKPLISATFPFREAVAAFERAAEGRPEDVKLQITL
ncbi:NAD(P)-dependent alcohol dehydrogenase [Swaminathania salitolerans]|uniref:Putative D-xylulose reductase n=1 Tax=Swaminathania salitolerans TaxID=182838 RepID=A0A511BN85_9PROT|nr:NAD(P)-dependent alcohol dehydrogenase [Swaminathania salitolerans]GBQ09990.1 alcohol dehydrogenase GroES domain protein [Swaminathania salitolerans LMG 21291]GEL01124.1 putative D-xylulose reductase [Swaminathania salitolerans]